MRCAIRPSTVPAAVRHLVREQVVGHRVERSSSYWQWETIDSTMLVM
jgi:hypothetical protein